MPFPNEHSARIKDPDLFDSDSFRSKELKSGIRIIIGKLKGESTMTAQAYRFSSSQFSAEEAKKWLKDNKVSYISFEAAEEKPEEELKHVGVKGMRWGVRRGPSKNSSDHEILKKARGKNIKNMSDEEIRSVVRRIRLVNQYRNANFIRQRRINELSNDELQAAVNKNNLKKGVLKQNPFSGITKLKSIEKMSDQDVKKLLDRMVLEKSFKDLTNRDFSVAQKLVQGLLVESITKTVQDAAKSK